MTNRFNTVKAEFLAEYNPSVHKQLMEIAKQNRSIYTLGKCFNAIRSYYKLTTEELKDHYRPPHVVLPRQHFCWVVYRNRMDVSYPTIAKYLGRNHTTVIHAVETFERRRDEMRKHIAAVDAIIRKGKL